MHGQEVAQADPRARRLLRVVSARVTSTGVVEAHRKVSQGRGARWPTSHITRGLGRAPQTTPDSVALDTVATLTPKHTRMDDFCAWHSYGFVTLVTLHINGCMSHSHHTTFNYSFGAFISRNLTAQLLKLTENGSKRCFRVNSRLPSKITFFE